MLLAKVQMLVTLVWKPLHKGKGVWWFSEYDFKGGVERVLWFVWEMCGWVRAALALPSLLLVVLGMSAEDSVLGPLAYCSCTESFKWLVLIDHREFKWDGMQDWVLDFRWSFLLVLKFFSIHFFCLLFILHTSRCVLIIYNPVLLTVDFPTANKNSKTCLFLSFLYTFYTIRRVLLFRNSPSITTFLLVVVLLLVF